jgi:hypothetical protein
MELKIKNVFILFFFIRLQTRIARDKAQNYLYFDAAQQALVI